MNDSEQLSQARLAHLRAPPQRVQMVLQIAALTLLASCGTVQAPVPLYGPDDELALLAGEWRGQYSSREAGRHGTIYFKLEAEADSAVGYVFMKPGSWESDLLDKTPRVYTPSEMLTIRFVEMGRGRVVGRLDEYRDPGCGCLLETIFEGHVEGDRIEGVYTSHGDHFHISTSGQWWVERLASPTAKRSP